MKHLLLLSLLLWSVSAFADVHVRGYTRSNGTYVAPHWRSSPNSSTLDNWSSQGNVNPYTAKIGSRSVQHWVSQAHQTENGASINSLPPLIEPVIPKTPQWAKKSKRLEILTFDDQRICNGCYVDVFGGYITKVFKPKEGYWPLKPMQHIDRKYISGEHLFDVPNKVSPITDGLIPVSSPVNYQQGAMSPNLPD